ncbi:hypothetical protein ARMGADRAFT_731053 [Armillaria gallica]|uniref:Uncharacterized protein n=1 Tax=Armillaria gallica TaxID=47427 RepID=A0A2H3CVX9_ARMGA|nr:hypothetical protein ARMGADRAFT_731053 [Armillaria gallica]
MIYPSRFSHPTAQKEKLGTDERRRLETFQLGIWKVSILKSTPLNFRKKFLDLKEAFGYFKRLAIDVYTLEHTLATFFVLNELWSGVQNALLLYLSSQMLRTIETGLIQGAPDIGAILKAVAVRVFFVVFAAILQWEKQRLLPALTTRITTHFELFLMQAQLRIDLPTSQKPRSQVRASSHDAWASFEVSRSTGLHLFAVVCIIKPVFLTLTQRALWNTAHVVHTDNEHRKRMTALNSMSCPGYRSEVFGSDIVNYIINEYRKATRLLGGLSDEWAPIQYMIRTSPVWEITNETLPFIYRHTPTIIAVPGLGHSVCCYEHQLLPETISGAQECL